MFLTVVESRGPKSKGTPTWSGQQQRMEGQLTKLQATLNFGSATNRRGGTKEPEEAEASDVWQDAVEQHRSKVPIQAPHERVPVQKRRESRWIAALASHYGESKSIDKGHSGQPQG
eukprot:14034988-Ditylum_brightwellii.AAC.1